VTGVPIGGAGTNGGKGGGGGERKSLKGLNASRERGGGGEKDRMY